MGGIVRCWDFSPEAAKDKHRKHQVKKPVHYSGGPKNKIHLDIRHSVEETVSLHRLEAQTKERREQIHRRYNNLEGLNMADMTDEEIVEYVMMLSKDQDDQDSSQIALEMQQIQEMEEELARGKQAISGSSNGGEGSSTAPSRFRSLQDDDERPTEQELEEEEELVRRAIALSMLDAELPSSDNHQSHLHENCEQEDLPRTHEYQPHSWEPSQIVEVDAVGGESMNQEDREIVNSILRDLEDEDDENVKSKNISEPWPTLGNSSTEVATTTTSGVTSPQPPPPLQQTIISQSTGGSSANGNNSQEESSSKKMTWSMIARTNSETSISSGLGGQKHGQDSQQQGNRQPVIIRQYPRSASQEEIEDEDTLLARILSLSMFLLPQTTPIRANTAKAVSVRNHTRNISTSRIQLQYQLEQQQRLASCLRVFGINTYQQQLRLLSQHQLRQIRLQRQAICTYTAKSISKGGVNTRREKTVLQSPLALSRSDVFLVSKLAQPSVLKARISVNIGNALESPRFISTSISPSFTPDPETDVSSSQFARVTISVDSSTSPIAAQPESIVPDSTAEITEKSSSDFQSLFPDIPASFINPASRDPFTLVKSETVPWRNSSMAEGSELEENLRKSVFQRDPIGTWWPMYEQVATQWRDRTNSNSASQQTTTAMVRSDFIRFVRGLQLSTLSKTSERLARLELIFEDFHSAIKTQKSNTRVYTTFMDTLHFWRQDELFPEWIEKIKSKIPSESSSSSEVSLLRESPQEQYHDIMRVLVDTNQVGAALKCLEELKASNSDRLRPTIKAYDTVLEGLVKQKDSISAMKVFQEMKDQGLPPQLTTFNILLRGYLANKDTRAVQRVLESLLLTDIRPDIYTFNLLMSGYLNMGQIELVNGFYKGLGEYGLVPNSKTYRILMKTHLRQGQVDQVVDLFSKLKDSPLAELHPGPEDYCILMQALVSRNRMSDALRLLRELTETRHTPLTTQIYNVFLTQYARGGQIEKARRILDKIISERLPLVDGSFNPLIRAYLEQKEYDKVEEISELMKRHGMQPSRATFNIMINSTKSSGNLSGAMALYERMIAEGVEPDVWTYNTLLDILVSKLAPSQDSYENKGYPRLSSDEQIQEFVPKIEGLLKEMKSKGITPDVVTYGKLIHQYVLLRDIEQAEFLLHEMVKVGISPNGFALNTLMNGFTLIQDMDKAVELFRRMRKYGVEADTTTFTTLIKGYSNMNQLSLAQDFANSLQQQSPRIQMDQYCLNTLMQLAQKSNQPGMAIDFFEMMRGRGIEPDKVTFTILINALSREFANFKGVDQSRRDDSDSSTLRRSRIKTASEAVESLLEVVKQGGYPSHHSQITSVITAYFRLGRPLAAIEYFKSSYWRSNMKLSTTNCGAMFYGLLAPEHKRRYDGIVLNLYSRMFVVTKETIRAKSSSRYPSRRQESNSKFVPKYNLPVLDLITTKILFRSFSYRNNWKIVLQLWEDLESIGPEKLYPFSMPIEFLGWAAQAYHLTPDLEETESSSREHGEQLQKKRRDLNKKEEAQRKEETHAEKSEKLLRRMWKINSYKAAEWSTKIYGQNIFESYNHPPRSISQPESTTHASSTISTHTQSSSSLMTSYLTDDEIITSYHTRTEGGESDDIIETSKHEEEGKGKERGKDEGL
ncbi:hypothetical protein BGZ49_002366 [Haplosporangium sp. Z 27]|nr:hypothetical protein BGZ49_002366 [Haplosporangium sp. Z 27]